jgi:NADH-quinone oxidoreductase subunit E/NADP-reducing hydrogenase subunit HndA
MPKIKLSEHAINVVKEVCASFGNNEGELINVLHQPSIGWGTFLPKCKS